MKKSLLTMTLFATVFSNISMAAPGDSVPNNFTNGTPANADEVNANFVELVNQISTLSTSGIAGPAGPQGPAGADAPAATTYNFRDFGNNFTTKTFTVNDTAGGYDQELRTFDRSITGQVSFSRDRSLNGTRVKYQTITLDTSGSDIRFTKFVIHNTADISLTPITRNMSPGVVFRTETMEQGKTFGSDSVLTETGTNGTSTSYVMQTGTLIASNQTITVPAGTFTGCIKISSHRSSTRLGGTQDRMQTFCPGVGLVKTVRGSFNGSVTNTLLKELTSCDGSAANCSQ